MRTNRHRYLTYLLVLTAILVTITLLVTSKAYADDDVTVLDDVQSAVVESVPVEASSSSDVTEPAVQDSDDSQVQAPEAGLEGEQGSTDDTAAVSDGAEQGTEPLADDTSSQTDDDAADIANDGAVTLDDGTGADVPTSSDTETGAVEDAAEAEVAVATEPDTAQGDADEVADDAQMLGTQATASSLRGVDISGWNDNIVFSKLGDFVIIKATEWSTKGYTYYTSGGNAGQTEALSYKKQAEAALKAGKLIGFYHFVSSYAYSHQTYEQQAQAFINAIKPYLGQAILVLDWENGEHYTSSGSSTVYSYVESDVAGAKRWLDYVYQQTGVKPVIYMNYGCANGYDWSSVAKAGYKLWGARYLYDYYYGVSGFVSNPKMYTKNDSYNRWGAWGKQPLIYQYTPACNLHGNKRYDANKFYGTKADWEKLAEAAHEISSTAAQAAKFLTNNAVYSFSPTGDAKYVAYASAGDAVLGNKNYRNGYWIVKNLGDGLYRFVNFRTGKALSFSPASGKVSNSTDVTTKGSVDIWKLVKCSNGTFALVPKGFGLYRLDVADGKLQVSGTNLGLHYHNGMAGQRFFFAKSGVLTSSYRASLSGKPVAEGVYTIKSVLGTNMVLDVKGGSTTNKANIQLYKSNRGLAQRFQLVYQGKGLYAIRSFKSGKLLEAASSSAPSGANVRQNASKLNLAQLWYVKEVDGAYRILSARSGKAITIDHGKSANGTNVLIFTPSNSNSQKFKLVHDSVLEKAVASGESVKPGFFTLTSVSTSKAVGVQGGSKADLANVRVSAYSGSIAQKFELVYKGNGLYAILNARSQKLLTISGNSTGSGANVLQNKSTGNRAQFWYITKSGDAYVIHSALSGTVLAVSGANVCVQTEGDSLTEQQFKLEDVPLYESGTYTLKSSLGGYRISVRNGTTSKGGNIQLWATSTHPAQRWHFTYLGSGLYKIVNGNSNLAMEVADGSTAAYANVQQGKYAGAAHQKWTLTLDGKGGIVIRNAASGMVLDVAGGKAESGANIRQRKGNGATGQSFVFGKVS